MFYTKNFTTNRGLMEKVYATFSSKVFLALLFFGAFSWSAQVAHAQTFPAGGACTVFDPQCVTPNQPIGNLLLPTCPSTSDFKLQIEFNAGGTTGDPTAFADHYWVLQVMTKDSCVLQTAPFNSNLGGALELSRSGNSLIVLIEPQDLNFITGGTNCTASLANPITSFADQDSLFISVQQRCDAPDLGCSNFSIIDTLLVPPTMDAFYAISSFGDTLELGYCTTNDDLALDGLTSERDTIGLNFTADIVATNQTITICAADWALVPSSENFDIVLLDGATGTPLTQSAVDAWTATGDTLVLDTVFIDGKRCLQINLQLNGDGNLGSLASNQIVAAGIALDCAMPVPTTLDRVTEDDFRFSWSSNMLTTNHSFKIRIYQGGTCNLGLSPADTSRTRPNMDNTHIFETIVDANDPRLVLIKDTVGTGETMSVTDSFQVTMSDLGFVGDECTCFQVFVFQICDGMDGTDVSSDWAPGAQFKSFQTPVNTSLLRTSLLTIPQVCNDTPSDTIKGGVSFIVEGGPCGQKEISILLSSEGYLDTFNYASYGTSSDSAFTAGTGPTASQVTFALSDTLLTGTYTAIITVSDTLTPGASFMDTLTFFIDLIDNVRPTARVTLEDVMAGAAYDVDTAGIITAVGASALPVGNKVNLGTIVLTAGSCSVDIDYLVTHMEDNCTPDANLQVYTEAIVGNVSSTTYVGVHDSTRNLQVNVAFGAFEFAVVIADTSSNPAINTNRVIYYGTVQEVTAPVIVPPSNTVYTIPECATTMDVFFTVQAQDACQGALELSAPNVFVSPAIGDTLIYVNNGMYMSENVAPGTYTVTVSNVSDDAGNIAPDRMFTLTINSGGVIVPRMIVGAGDISAIIPACESLVDVTFDLFIVDECAEDPVFDDVSNDGGYAITGGLNGRYTLNNVPADQTVVVTATSGTATYSFNVITTQSEVNQRPDITLQGNLNYTLPVCSLNGEYVTFGVHIDDDCDSPAFLANEAQFFLDGVEIFPTTTDFLSNGQAYFEFYELIRVENDGDFFSVTVEDSEGLTSSLAIQLSVFQDERATTYACIPNINLTVGSDCSLEVQPSMLLKGDQTKICNDLLQAIIEKRDENGNFEGYYTQNLVINTGTFNYAILPAGEEYLTRNGAGQIIDFSSDAMICWGQLTAEDKSAPVGFCLEDVFTAQRAVAFNYWNGTLAVGTPFYPQVFSCYQSTWPGGISEFPNPPTPPYFPPYVDPNAEHYYDTWTFKPAQDGVYTFFLFAEFDATMAVFQQADPDTFLSALAPFSVNGWFDPVVPCANIVGFGESVFTASPTGGLGFDFTTVTAPSFPAWVLSNDSPLMRIALPLQADREYTLMVTSRDAELTGNFLVEVQRDGADDEIEAALMTGDPLDQLYIPILEYWDPVYDLFGNVVPAFSVYPSYYHLMDLPLYCDDINRIYISPTEARCYTLNADYDNPTNNHDPLGDFRLNDAVIDSTLKNKLFYTGYPVVTDNCGPVTVCVSDRITKRGDCGELYIDRTFTATDAAGNPAEWYETGDPVIVNGGANSCVQRISFSIPSISNLILPHFTQYLECDEGYETDANGSPHPNVTGYPFLQSAFGYHDLANDYCNLAASYSDESVIASCNGGLKVRREWTILDWCRPGKSIIYNQVIKAGDYSAPEMTAPEPQTVGYDIITYSVSPFDCDADFQVPVPATTDNCSSNILVYYAIEENVDIPQYDNFGNIIGYINEWRVVRQGLAGTMVAALPPDRVYRYHYTAQDACLNQSELYVSFQVLDLVEPLTACDNSIIISLGGGSFELGNSIDDGGYARLESFEFQEGISDNCGTVEYWVRRVVAPSCFASFDFDGDGIIVGDELIEAQVNNQTVVVTNYRVGAAGNQDGYFEEVVPNMNMSFTWQPYAEFFCCDAGEEIMVEVIAIDEAGNTNRCMMMVTLEDNTNPYCAAPADINGMCNDNTLVPADFNPPADLAAYNALSEFEKAGLHAQLDILFGAPEITDNCNAITVMQSVVALAWDCGAGSIRRRFWSVDGFGNVSANNCFQNIMINRIHDYNFCFPADASGSCAAVLDTFDIGAMSTGCDLISLYVKDQQFSASGDECYQIFRTFEVVNWCQFTGDDLSISSPFIVGRDEDCDNKPGDEGVCVSFTRLSNGNDYIFIDRDRNPFNTSPTSIQNTCFGTGGFWRKEGPICTPSNIGIICPTSYTQANPPAGANAIFMPGFFRYTQIISVYDNTPPMIMANLEPSYCAFGTNPSTAAEAGSTTWLNANCGLASASIPISVMDACTPDDLRLDVILRVNISSTGNPAMSYTLPIAAGTASDIGYPDLEADLSALSGAPGDTKTAVIRGFFPTGNHQFEIRATDGCGNTSITIRDFIVVDCLAPAPTCTAGLTVSLMPFDENNNGTIDDGRMVVWARDYIAGDAFDCSGSVKYSIHLSREPAPQSLDLSLIEQIERFVVQEKDLELSDLLDPSQTSELVTCEDAGKTLMVVIAAWDAYGNGDYCTTFLVVNDPMEICGSSVQSPSVAGLITTENDHTVENVAVNLSGMMQAEMMTPTNGGYVFSNLKAGEDYTITPLLDERHGNGVTTFDVIEMARHILSVKPLDSPYKMIAADIDNNKAVTTLDMIQLRRLILGVETEFANNTSWRFIDANYKFPDPKNPWLESFPEVVNVNDLNQSMITGDFVAVKVGDVTLDAVANQLMSDSRSYAGDFRFSVEEQELLPGASYSITFKAEETAQLQGFQFTLQLDPEAAVITGLEYGVATKENFGTAYLSEGVLTSSWNGVAPAGEAFFTLEVQAKKRTRLSNVLQLNSRLTTAEVYQSSGQHLRPVLAFNNVAPAANSPELYQNTPNPFSGKTAIGFSLPEKGSATLTVTDLTGKRLKVMRGSFDAGYNEFIWEAADLPVTGVLYYTLETGNFTQTRKMVRVE